MYDSVNYSILLAFQSNLDSRMKPVCYRQWIVAKRSRGLLRGSLQAFDKPRNSTGHFVFFHWPLATTCIERCRVFVQLDAKPGVRADYRSLFSDKIDSLGGYHVCCGDKICANYGCTARYALLTMNLFMVLVKGRCFVG